MGVDFLARRPTFFLNDRNLETKSQKIVPKVGNEPLVARWLVGWWMWRAGCISQDTYLLYVANFQNLSVFSSFTA